MNPIIHKRLTSWFPALLLALVAAIPLYLLAQGPQGPAGQGKGAAGQGKGDGKGKGFPGPPANPRQAAPIDITGYWVSLVTEDWIYRMVTPPKGDVASVPVNAAGRGAANEWDPAKDEAAGEPCKAYGAVGIVRMPGHMHIEWQDDSTLKIDFDAGTQTRLLHFNGTPPATGDAGYQGYAVASWEGVGRGGRGGFGGPPGAGPGGPPPGGAAGPGGPGAPPAPGVRPGALKVVTTRMKPGYLRKNGVPYSANTILTEYFDHVTLPGGDELLIVKSIVDDAEYLTQEFITSTHFKKEADGSKWSPSACSAK